MNRISSYVQNLILSIIILIAAIFLLNAARGDSAIFDETAHIVAGYTYVSHLDYRFNPEHPPLVKMLAGAPLLFQNLNFSTDKGYWNGLNEQWWAGNEFLYKSGNNADKIIFTARLGPILLTLFAIFFVYYFAKEIVGRWWALFPAFLFGFSPMVLAHGHYVTTDVAATLGVLLTIFYFVRLLDNYNSKNIFIAAAAFGFAQAVKFSSVLLIPTMILAAAVYSLINHQNIFKALYQNWKAIFFTILIGYLAVVYPLYLFTTWNYPIEKQTTDARALIGQFSIQPLAQLNIWMSGNKILRPLAEYLLGVLMVFQRSAGGNGAYFLGKLSSHGWRYYFPLIYIMKESLPALTFIFMGFLFGLIGIIKSFKNRFLLAEKLKEYLNVRFLEFTSLIFIIIYWLTSISSPLNIGVRHILPTIPFIYILSTGAIKKWFSSGPLEIVTNWLEKMENNWHFVFNFWLKTLLLTILVIWVIAETALASPYFLSYYNEFFGWRINGFHYATDSNFDWGQDLTRFKKWIEKNLDPKEKIAVDYFGGGDIRYYLGNQAEPWSSSRGNPKDENIHWLAISANTLIGALANPVSGFYINPADEYLWLKNPYGFLDRAGTSIFIYKP